MIKIAVSSLAHCWWSFWNWTQKTIICFQNTSSCCRSQQSWMKTTWEWSSINRLSSYYAFHLMYCFLWINLLSNRFCLFLNTIKMIKCQAIKWFVHLTWNHTLINIWKTSSVLRQLLPHHSQIILGNLRQFFLPLSNSLWLSRRSVWNRLEFII